MGSAKTLTTNKHALIIFLKDMTPPGSIDLGPRELMNAFAGIKIGRKPLLGKPSKRAFVIAKHQKEELQSRPAEGSRKSGLKPFVW